MPGLRIAVIGKSGSGKTTVAAGLSKQLGLPAISSGELIREAARGEEPSARALADLVERGELVTEGVAAELVAQRLRKPDARAGWVLDGYPRRLSEAQALRDRLGEVPDLLLHLELSDDEARSRLIARQQCLECGASFGLANPSRSTVCDACGGELTRRADDEPDAIDRRLQSFFDELPRLLGHYSAAIVTIDASSPLTQVEMAALRAVNAENEWQTRS